MPRTMFFTSKGKLFKRLVFVFFKCYNRLMEMSTNKKRILIISIYSAIFLAIVLAIYFALRPNATCSDGKQNQNEKGIDCGGVCVPCEEKSGKDLVVVEKTFVDGGNGTYDFIVKVNNPNNKIGSPSFSYIVKLLDNSGTVVSEKKGKTYILPAESRYIAELGLTPTNGATPTSATFEVTNVEWKTLTGVSKPSLNIYNKNVQTESAGSNVSAQALLRNESSYDLAKIRIIGVLRDGSGNIIAVNSTEKETVRAGEERDFKFIWPYALKGEVQSFEADALADLYDGQNFLNTKYEQQDFR